MQIKTITCHEVYNHGAILQEYALVFYLNSQGHSTQVIHYKPWYLRNNFSILHVPPRYSKIFIKYLYIGAKLSFKLKSLKRKKNFDLFAHQNIPTDRQLYKSNEDLIKNLPKADAYICGSDQIWNSYFENGKDPAFYLNFVPNNKLKISYAASFAIDAVQEEFKALAKENLISFKAISVRETSGVRILKEIGIRNVAQVLDPVFLLPSIHWDNFMQDIDSKFIFIYDFDSNPLVKVIALHLKKEKGYKIYTVNQNIKYADKNFYTKGPEVFLSLVKQAQQTITNSFHALTFSLIFNKEVIVVNRNVEINTRMRDLLSLLEVNRLVNSFEDFLEVQPINYEKVNKLLAEKIIYSQEFLLSNLK